MMIAGDSIPIRAVMVGRVGDPVVFRVKGLSTVIARLLMRCRWWLMTNQLLCVGS